MIQEGGTIKNLIEEAVEYACNSIYEAHNILYLKLNPNETTVPYKNEKKSVIYNLKRCIANDEVELSNVKIHTNFVKNKTSFSKVKKSLRTFWKESSNKEIQGNVSEICCSRI